MPDYHQLTPCRLFAKRVGESLKSGLCGLQQTVQEACEVVDKCPNHTELLELFAKVRRQTIELEGLLNRICPIAPTVPTCSCLASHRAPIFLVFF
jgi:hypothetical protein